MPEQARGGTDICRVDPRTRGFEQITKSEPPVWDFRQTESPDGKSILFCRAETGGSPAIWIMDAGGGNERLLTRGFENRGADHPRWLP
jgi:TolB protein